MANRRAQLAVHELEGAFVPLTPVRSVATPPAALDALETTSPVASASYPALNKPQKERLVGCSFRLPVSQVEALDALKKQGVVVSELVRDFIAEGLANIKTG